jgi:outer membrane lipoprotein SlyB
MRQSGLGRKKAVAGVTAVAMLVSGCATLTRSGRIGPDDGKDACRAYVVALDSTGDFFAENMLKGAAIGALSGAAIGALASGGGSGAGRNALIGAVAGAAAGAAAGYWQSKMEQGADQAILSVKRDLSREIDQMDKSNQAFSQVLDCRKAQFAQIRSNVQARVLPRAQAEALWMTQRGYLDRDLRLAALINQDMLKRGQDFDFANQQVNGQVPPEPSAPPAPELAAPVSEPAPAKKAGKAKAAAAATPAAKPKPKPKPQVQAKEPELAQLSATRQHKAGEFDAKLQSAQSLAQEAQSPGFTDSGWLYPLALPNWLG